MELWFKHKIRVHYFHDINICGLIMARQREKRSIRKPQGARSQHVSRTKYIHTTYIPAARQYSCRSGGGGGGGGKGAMAPLSLLKLVIKKMAATCGALYFMFLALPDNPGSHAAIVILHFLYLMTRVNAV